MESYRAFWDRPVCSSQYVTASEVDQRFQRLLFVCQSQIVDPCLLVKRPMHREKQAEIMYSTYQASVLQQ